MPSYKNFPADWVTALDRSTGSAPYIEVIFDPDGSAVTVDSNHSCMDISPVANERSLDQSYGAQPIIGDVTLKFNDPDNYFNPQNKNGILHDCVAELTEDHASGATTIKLLGWPEIDLVAGEKLVINNGVNSEIITVVTFTAAAGSTYTHQFTIAAPGLSRAYSSRVRAYTIPIEGREVLVNLKMVGCVAAISSFRGRIIKKPELSTGFAQITLTRFDKKILDQIVIGADSDANKKLMIIGQSGSLQTSILWSRGWGDPPYVWTLDSGSLPTGLSINKDTGIISGAPTELGTFTPTLKVTNGAGESITAQISLTVKNYINEEFLSADALSTYTRNGSADINIVTDSFVRTAFILKNEWNSSSYKARTVLRTDMTGDWALRGKFKMLTTPVDQFEVGLCVKWETGATGLLFGFSGNLTNMLAYKIGSSPFWVGTWSGVRTEWELMIKKVGYNYACYRREAGQTTWTICDTNAQVDAIAGIGLFCSTATDNRSISVESDWLRFSAGVIGFARTITSKGRVGLDYSCFIEGQGGAGEYVHSISVGSLPAGLTINSVTGEISGRPTEAGSITFTVLITDALGATASQSFTIEVVDAVAVMPTVLDSAYKNKTYSKSMIVNATGDLSRTGVTVYPSCRVGTWSIKFTSATAFVIDGPGVAGVTGSISSDFMIPGILGIASSAWSGSINTGDEMEFKTCVSWENANPAQVLHDILFLKAGISSNMINASSFFVKKFIGKFYTVPTPGSNKTIQIAVSGPTVLSSSESMVIEEGALSEECAIITGNTESASFPPFIQVVITFSSSFTSAAKIYWKKRTSVLSAGNSFDDEYDYCDKQGLRISLSVDREMNVAQLVEVVAAHFDAFVFYDNWGIAGVYSFRPRYLSNIPEIDEIIILSAGPTEEMQELVNEIIVEYGYDYSDGKYLYKSTFPESDALNKSFSRNGFKRTVSVKLPGIYSEWIAKAIARRKYFTFENGLTKIRVPVDLRGISVKIGDTFLISYSPTGFSREVYIIGVRHNLRSFESELVGVDRSPWSEWFMVNLSKLNTSKRIW